MVFASLAAFLPILHMGGPPPRGPYWTHWYLDPQLVLFIFGVTALYLAWVGPLNRRRPNPEQRPVTRQELTFFLSGSVICLLALGPPLDDWSDYFLLSAHMFQHLLLIMLVAPLWLIGIPGWVFEPLVRNRITGPIGRVLTMPLVAYAIANGVFVAWHFPTLYDAAILSPALHRIEHQSFLLTAMLAWWPIFSKVPAWPRPPALVKCLYLFLMTIPGGIVGAFITMAEPGLYAPYLRFERMWGVSVATDQEIGGLLMWVGANSIYLIVLTVVFFRWAGQEEAKNRSEPIPKAVAGQS